MTERTIIRERRRGKRAKKPVNCLILPEDASCDFVGVTNDLSCVGANCKINKHIPELTRLRLTLELDSGKQTFDGMVVRCDEITNGEFDTAIYFTNIDLRARRSIDEFVKSQKRERRENIQEFLIDG